MIGGSGPLPLRKTYKCVNIHNEIWRYDFTRKIWNLLWGLTFAGTPFFILNRILNLAQVAGCLISESPTISILSKPDEE
jgi:hypothetical protein